MESQQWRLHYVACKLVPNASGVPPPPTEFIKGDSEQSSITGLHRQGWNINTLSSVSQGGRGGGICFVKN